MQEQEQHQQQQQQPELVVPQVIEPSVGVGRLVLALLCSAYRQDRTTTQTTTKARVVEMADITCEKV